LKKIKRIIKIVTRKKILIRIRRRYAINSAIYVLIDDEYAAKSKFNGKSRNG